MLTTKADIKGLLSGVVGQSSDFDLNGVDEWPTATMHAGVLVPIIKRASGLSLILTKRAAHLKSHPGQISFPGGKVEKTDTDIADTAKREAEEEIGLPRENLTILGILPTHTTVTGFLVTPVVAWVNHDWQVQVDPGEVAEVFEVPLSFVLNPSNYQVQGRKWRGQERYYYTVPFGPYYIWGATARILRGMADQAVV